MEALLGRPVGMLRRHPLRFRFLYYVTHPINDPGIRRSLTVEVHTAIQSLRLEPDHNGRRVHVPSGSTGGHTTSCSICTYTSIWFTERILKGSGWKTRRCPPVIGSRL